MKNERVFAGGRQAAGGTIGRGAEETDQGNKCRGAYVREYSERLEAELQEVCDSIPALTNENFISSASKGESKMFFYKMKGDDHRHFAESKTGDADSEVAVDGPVAYDEDTKTARKDLVVIHPLSLILNFSGSQLDVIQNPEEACKMSRVASEDLFAKASRASYRDEGTPKKSQKKSDFEAEDAKHSAKLEAAVDGENLTLQLDQGAVSKRQLQMDTTCADKQVCGKEYVESVEEGRDDESNDAEERISALAKLGKAIWQPCDISQPTAECLLMCCHRRESWLHAEMTSGPCREEQKTSVNVSRHRTLRCAKGVKPLLWRSTVVLNFLGPYKKKMRNTAKVTNTN